MGDFVALEISSLATIPLLENMIANINVLCNGNEGYC